MEVLREHSVSIRKITIHVTVGQHGHMGSYQPFLAFSRSCASKAQKKSHDFSLIFPTFYSLLSILKATVRLQETNSLKATSFQKVIGVLKKKRQQSFLQGRPHSSYSLMCCKPRLGTHRHIPSCAWIYPWLWKPIYPVAMSSTV